MVVVLFVIFIFLFVLVHATNYIADDQIDEVVSLYKFALSMFAIMLCLYALCYMVLPQPNHDSRYWTKISSKDFIDIQGNKKIVLIIKKGHPSLGPVPLYKKKSIVDDKEESVETIEYFFNNEVFIDAQETSQTID